MGHLAKVSTRDITNLDSVRPLASVSCSELVLIDWNYTGIGDGATPVGRTEAERSESMAHMSAMGPVANIHNRITLLQSQEFILMAIQSRNGWC